MLTAEALVQQALLARQRAYAPYSHYTVGAALLMADGTVIYGCNVENAAYGATICAERVALTSAIAQGQHDFIAIAVATKNGGSPCGICRQVMAELGPAMLVYITDETGNFRTTSVAELLPDWFRGENLLN
ncbi:MAG: cytidine deaminase [Chloroflexi bacterium]|nr:cytidine deaminase [Chloroflexota bacterium]